MSGGWGLGPVAEVASALADAGVHVLAVAGRNTRLEAALRAAARRQPVIRAFGYTDRIPELMAASDLVITSSGSTCAEARAVGRPLLVLDVVPGHGRDNCQHELELGHASVTSADPAAVVASALAALAVPPGPPGGRLPAGQRPRAAASPGRLGGGLLRGPRRPAPSGSGSPWFAAVTGGLAGLGRAFSGPGDEQHDEDDQADPRPGAERPRPRGERHRQGVPGEHRDRDDDGDEQQPAGGAALVQPGRQVRPFRPCRPAAGVGGRSANSPPRSR